MDHDALDLFFDGCCEPHNPGGTACFGWALLAHGRLLHKSKGFVCRGESATNNVAEYSALVDALAFLLRQGYTQVPVTVRGDSQLVVRQIHGEYAVHSPLLLPLYREARDLLARLPQVHLEWIPRERNQLADRLSHEACRASLAGLVAPVADPASPAPATTLPPLPSQPLPGCPVPGASPVPAAPPLAHLASEAADEARLDLIRAVFAGAREQFGNDNAARLDWNEWVTGTRSCWAMTWGQLKTLLVSYAWRAGHADRSAAIDAANRSVAHPLPPTP